MGGVFVSSLSPSLSRSLSLAFSSRARRFCCSVASPVRQGPELLPGPGHQMHQSMEADDEPAACCVLPAPLFCSLVSAAGRCAATTTTTRCGAGRKRASWSLSRARLDPPGMHEADVTPSQAERRTFYHTLQVGARSLFFGS
jgi:hypothetical protein